jgi:hypothetical protein
VGALKITFVDSGRYPKCPPDPKFPDGIDVDLAFGAAPTCTVAVPYPSPRCGYLKIECERCGLAVAVTVAGRADDVRQVTVACHRPKETVH